MRFLTRVTSTLPATAASPAAEPLSTALLKVLSVSAATARSPPSISAVLRVVAFFTPTQARVVLSLMPTPNAAPTPTPPPAPVSASEL